MKLDLPRDHEADGLAEALAARDDLSSSARAWFITLRTWNAIVVVGLTIGFVLFACATLAAVLLFFLVELDGRLVAACAVSCGASVGLHIALQRLQRVLLRRLLPKSLRDDGVGGATPVAIKAFGAPPPD